MPNEYFTHEKSRVEGRREHLSRSYNQHPESKKNKIKRETIGGRELSNKKNGKEKGNTFLLL